MGVRTTFAELSGSLPDGQWNYAAKHDGVLVVVGENSDKIMRSLDDGDTFTDVTPVGFGAGSGVCWHGGDSTFYAIDAYGDKVWKSATGAAPWTQAAGTLLLPPLSNAGPYPFISGFGDYGGGTADLIVVPQYADSFASYPGNVITVGISHDGGATWPDSIDLPLSRVYAMAVDPDTTDTLFLLGVSAQFNVPAIARTYDGGQTWEEIILPTGDQTSPGYFGIAYNSWDGVLVVVGNDDTAAYSLDYGDTWSAVHVGLGDDDDVNYMLNVTANPGGFTATTYQKIATSRFGREWDVRDQLASMFETTNRIFGFPDSNKVFLLPYLTGTLGLWVGETEVIAGSDLIVFEPLISSVVNIGDGIVEFSLEAVGADVTSLGRIAFALEAEGEGEYTEHESGEASIELFALLRVVAAAQANVGVCFLPELEVAGIDGSELIPSSGSADFDLFALEVESTGGYGRIGSVDVELFTLQAYGFEDDGPWCVAVLPSLLASGSDIQPYPDGIMLLQMSPGYLYMAEATTNGAEEVICQDVAVCIHVANATEQVVPADSVKSIWRSTIAVEDGITLDAIARIVFIIAAEDSLVPEDSEADFKKTVIRVVDSLVAVGLAESVLEATYMVSDAVVLEALEKHGYIELIEDELVVNDEAYNMVRAIHALVDSIVVEDELHFGARFTIMLEDGIVLQDTAASRAVFIERCEESLLCIARLRIFGEEWDAYAINARSRAASRFTGYNFNSFVDLNKKHYAFGEDGLYLLEGADDDGTQIKATVRSALTEMGRIGIKQILMAYLYYKSDGQLVFKVLTTSPEGQKEVHWFLLEGRTADAFREDRVPDIGQGIEGNYFAFEITNLEGADFEFDKTRVLPFVLTRRV